jgi:hypothetical protein
VSLSRPRPHEDTVEREQLTSLAVCETGHQADQFESVVAVKHRKDRATRGGVARNIDLHNAIDITERPPLRRPFRIGLGHFSETTTSVTGGLE